MTAARFFKGPADGCVITIEHVHHTIEWHVKLDYDMTEMYGVGDALVRYKMFNMHGDEVWYLRDGWVATMIKQDYVIDDIMKLDFPRMTEDQLQRMMFKQVYDKADLRTIITERYDFSHDFSTKFIATGYSFEREDVHRTVRRAVGAPHRAIQPPDE